MADQAQSPEDREISARRSIDRQVARSRWALAAERLARAFWPVPSLIFFLGAVWVLGLGWVLEPRRQIGSAVLALAALAWLLWRGSRGFRWPTRAEATARLEARLPGRPISALDDTQAIGSDDAASRAVWTRHLERMAERAAAARASAPDLRLARFDPFRAAADRAGRSRAGRAFRRPRRATRRRRRPARGRRRCRRQRPQFRGLGQPARLYGPPDNLFRPRHAPKPRPAPRHRDHRAGLWRGRRFHPGRDRLGRHQPARRDRTRHPRRNLPGHRIGRGHAQPRGRDARDADGHHDPRTPRPR